MLKTNICIELSETTDGILHKRQLITRTRVINRVTENAKSRGLMHSGWIKVFRNLRVRTSCFVISKLITSDLGHGNCDNT